MLEKIINNIRVAQGEPHSYSGYIRIVNGSDGNLGNQVHITTKENNQGPTALWLNREQTEELIEALYRQLKWSFPATDDQLLDRMRRI